MLAKQTRDTSTEWLKQNPGLRVHKNNNVIVKAHEGLHFLGHRIYPNFSVSVDKHMVNKILSDACSKNISSYRAMRLPRRKHNLLPWLLIDS